MPASSFAGFAVSNSIFRSNSQTNMGNDGGSIPKRDELVTLKKKKETISHQENSKIKWNVCTLSKEPLKEPVVSDELGRLYNKETVLSHLLQKTFPKELSYITRMKDLITLRLTKNPISSEESQFICPVTMVETGTNFKFVAIRTCGCVLSQRALKEVPTDKCLVCSSTFDPVSNLKN